MTATVETVKVQMAHVRAMHDARTAAQALADKYFNGRDGGACGFAWVTIRDVRSNSKMGKALQEVGFRKAYGGGLQLWNQWWPGQSVDAAEHGATAYAAAIQEELGVKAYSGSRLD